MSFRSAWNNAVKIIKEPTSNITVGAGSLVAGATLAVAMVVAPPVVIPVAVVYGSALVTTKIITARHNIKNNH
jgi:hypothetical protein